MKVTSELPQCIVALTMARSGHHAIGHWLLSQYEEELTHFHSNLYIPGPMKKTYPLDYRILDHLKVRYPPKGDGHKWFVSIEDFTLKDIEKSEFPKHMKNVADPHFVIIIRDPFNWIASRLSLSINEFEVLPEAIDTWKGLAKAHKRKKLLGFPLTVIKYNQWLKSDKYRERIAKTICGKHVFDNISLKTGTTAFDTHPADEPEVTLKRWKKALDDPKVRDIYTKLTSDPELAELSEKVFAYKKPF